jgi:hypothetical protein
MDGMNGISQNKWATTSYIHFFSLLHSTIRRFISEQMKNREKWRLIIQEVKAHPEL